MDTTQELNEAGKGGWSAFIAKVIIAIMTLEANEGTCTLAMLRSELDSFWPNSLNAKPETLLLLLKAKRFLSFSDDLVAVTDEGEWWAENFDEAGWTEFNKRKKRSTQ